VVSGSRGKAILDSLRIYRNLRKPMNIYEIR
jgi:hypothetical protein